MIASLAGRWGDGRDAGTDRRVEALAGGRGGPTVRGGPFLLTGESAVSRSPGGCLAVLAGRVYDGTGTDRSGPAHWLAAEYERSGSRALEALRGEFVAVLWDPQRRIGVIARDQLGGRCLNYHATPGGLVFAEEIRDLLALLAVGPQPDRRAVVSLAGFGMIPFGRSVYEGVQRLPPGHLLRLHGGRWTPERWWRPHYHGVGDGDREELAERVVAGLDRAVGRCTAGAAVAVMLSGGLDSSAVISSATAQCTSAHGPVGYSAVFPDHPAADEAALIDELLAALGIRGVRLVYSTGSAVGGALEHLSRWGVPSASPNHHLWRPLLARAHRDGFRVLLDGQGGDEIFGVSRALVGDRLRQGRVLDTWRLTRAMTGVGPQARRRRVARLLLQNGLPQIFGPAQRLTGRGHAPRVPAWVMHHDAATVCADLDERRGAIGSSPLWWRDQAHRITDARELFDVHGYLRRRAAEVGLESRHPLLHDVDLVDMVLALPPESRFDPDHDRVLLRHGLAGRLPDSIRLRQQKSRFNVILDDAMMGADGRLLSELLSDRAAEVRAYVRPDRLDAELLRPGPKGFPAGRSAWALALWRLGSVELWLRTLRDPASFQACARGIPAHAEDRFEEVGGARAPPRSTFLGLCTTRCSG